MNTIRRTFLSCAKYPRLNLSSVARAKNVAVVLSGNGVYDGSECTEAIATLVHLSRAGVNVQCFAPNVEQMHAVDHTSGSLHDKTRNVLEESARLARGNIKALSDLSAFNEDFNAVVFPGGFGAAKNLSTWAIDGPKATVQEDVKKVIVDFHASGKPIGACCIAPTLIALALPNEGIKMTVGMEEGADGTAWPYAGTATQIKELGVGHVPCEVGEVVVDADHKIVTSPAYMYEGKPHEIFDSVGKMVEGVLMLL